MNYQECNVVMLPTKQYNREGILVVREHDNKLMMHTDKVEFHGQNQHLYITNPNEEIKEGDWFYDKYANQVFQVNEHHVIAKWWCKIIATTDESLGLPQIPIDFIKQYCELNGINKVLVWYDITYGDEVGHPMHWGQIEKRKSKLIISSDNTILIKPIKDSWSREEVIELLRQYNAHIINTNDEALGPYQFNYWIKENL